MPSPATPLRPLAEPVPVRPAPAGAGAADDGVDYPDSDGQPMGESELHFDWMVRLVEMLRLHLRPRGIHVGGNMFFYYEAGNPRKSFAPDLYAIKDCDPDRRFRIIKVWEDGYVPCFVLETTSEKTRREDRGKKRRIYRRLGIREYFLYDPTADWLDPPLQGFRLTGTRYVPVRPSADGELASEELGLLLRLDAGRLVISDAATGRSLKTGYELAGEERARATAAERRVAELEAELARLKSGGSGKRTKGGRR
jgi:Uma2 family endonuclease